MIGGGIGISGIGDIGGSSNTPVKAIEITVTGIILQKIVLQGMILQC